MKVKGIVMIAAVLTALVGPAVPAQAEDCKGSEGQGARFVLCKLGLEGCVASGPVAIDPVVCN